MIKRNLTLPCVECLKRGHKIEDNFNMEKVQKVEKMVQNCSLETTES